MRLLLAILLSLSFQSCSTTYNTHHSSVYCITCVRDDNDGHIHRDMAARKAFMEQSGYPDGRASYVVDHIVPLYKGGKDTPENMQWLTIEQHKEKHRDL
ncbi:MAG: HNH endonuclease signature motif containing protein [Proteobacteria bacterium]|nr:HNH endonuclease signature motif containing protein [Pseudomonadota bacterium]